MLGPYRLPKPGIEGRGGLKQQPHFLTRGNSNERRKRPRANWGRNELDATPVQFSGISVQLGVVRRVAARHCLVLELGVNQLNGELKKMNFKNTSRILGGALVALLMCLCLTGTTIQAQQTMPLGPYGQVPIRTGNTAADTATLVLGQMSTLLTGTPTAAANYTTPTATLLCSLFPFVGSGGVNNFSWDFFVKNTSAGANTITVVGGTGVTVTGTATIAQNAIKHFKIVLTACPIPGTTSPTAVAQVLSLGSSTF